MDKLHRRCIFLVLISSAKYEIREGESRLERVKLYRLATHRIYLLVNYLGGPNYRSLYIDPFKLHLIIESIEYIQYEAKFSPNSQTRR